MKCYVCGTDNIESKARCPLCGFPVPRIVGDNGQEMEKLKEMAGKYRQKKLEGWKTGMTIYRHEKKGEDLEFNVEQKICLADCSELQIGEIFWNDQKFARVDANGPVELKVWVQKAQQPEKYGTVRVQAPDSEGFWQVGVRMQHGWKLQFVLKDDKKQFASDDFSMDELIQ